MSLCIPSKKINRVINEMLNLIDNLNYFEREKLKVEQSIKLIEQNSNADQNELKQQITLLDDCQNKISIIY